MNYGMGNTYAGGHATAQGHQAYGSFIDAQIPETPMFDKGSQRRQVTPWSRLIRRVLVIAAVFFVIRVVVFFAVASHHPATTPYTPSVAPSFTPSQVSTVNVGQPLVVGNLTYTAESVVDPQGADATVPPGTRLVGVNLQVQNVSGSSQPLYYPMNTSLRDASGHEYVPWPWTARTVPPPSVAAQGTIQYQGTFDVPVSSQGLQLVVVDSDLLNQHRGVINLSTGAQSPSGTTGNVQQF